MHQARGIYEAKVLNDPELPVQIINQLYEKESSFWPHWHEHLEVYFVAQGTGRVQINQTFYELSPGDVAVFNSCETHCDWCVTPPYSFVVVIFDLKDISRELAQMNILFRPIIRQDKTIAALFKRIQKEFLDAQPGGKQVCKALVTDLVVYLMRNYKAHTLIDRESLQRKKDLVRLNAALQHIDQNHPQPLTNDALAKIANMSESRFIHLFRQCVGLPPMQYLRDIRLRKAHSLLTTGNMSATDVCFAVGFRDYNNFGRLFLKRFGVTPSEVHRKT